jgi:hypothetical protein
MNQKQQREYVYWRAPQMARSGQFRNWHEIEAQLRYEGAPEAQHELRSNATRRWLDQLCDEARQD